MRRMLWGLLIAAVLSSSGVYGGGVVGSGAGIVEMNFDYAYLLLPSWIKSCQKMPHPDNIALGVCDREGVRAQLFEKIIRVAQDNQSRKDRLVYLSEAEHPQFFRTGVSEPHRIARTFLNPDSAIYINVDQLYNREDGSPALDLPLITAILVHEVGHQSGEPSHDLLNELAAQLRTFLNMNIKSFEIELPESKEDAQILFVNQKDQLRATMIFNWPSHYSTNLTGHLYQFAKCRGADDVYKGFNLSNGQFVLNSADDIYFDFSFWMDVHCEKNNTKKLRKYRKLVSARLTDKRAFEFRLMDELKDAH